MDEAQRKDANRPETAREADWHKVQLRAADFEYLQQKANRDNTSIAA